MSRENHDPTARSILHRGGKEEANSLLNLGEFQNTDALTHSEVQLVLTALLQRRKEEGKANEST